MYGGKNQLAWIWNKITPLSPYVYRRFRFLSIFECTDRHSPFFHSVTQTFPLRLCTAALTFPTVCAVPPMLTGVIVAIVLSTIVVRHYKRPCLPVDMVMEA